jgi:hypothetical protein
MSVARDLPVICIASLISISSLTKDASVIKATHPLSYNDTTDCTIR